MKLKDPDLTQVPEILICFDTDGIFKQEEEDCQYVTGPIDPLVVKKLQKECEIFIVSESPYYPKNKDGTPMFQIQNDLPGRWLNIQETYNIYWEKYGQEPSAKLYVSDNGDYNEAAKAEFVYIRHDLFLRTMKSLGLV